MLATDPTGNPAPEPGGGAPSPATEQGDSSAAPVSAESAQVPDGGEAVSENSAGDRERLIALLSAYEGPGPRRAQLQSAATDPAAELIALSKDTGQTGAVRQGALRALGTIGGTEPTQRIREVLASKVIAAEKRAAIQGAALLLAESGVLRSEIAVSLRDPNAGVARAAVQALAEDPESRPELEALSQEEVPGAVRSALNVALGVPASPIATPEATPLPGATKAAGGGRR